SDFEFPELLVPQVIDLDETNPCAVVFSGENRGESTRRKRVVHACLGWHKSRPQERDPAAIIRIQQGAIAVAQFEGWIDQSIRYPKGYQARPDSPYHDVGIAVPAQNEARDHDIGTRADKGSRADIGQRRRGCVTKIINFHQAYACGII